MWSNARGCPRVNGGGPLAVLASSVCSGRGGRRLVFWVSPRGGSVVSRGGSPPHPPSTIHSGAVVSRGGSPPHPPSTIHSGILGAGVAGGGLCRVGCGVPPQAPGPDPGEGRGCALGALVARVGGVPGGLRGYPQAFCLRVVGEGRGSRPPSPARGECAGLGSTLRCRSGGGVGAQPPHKESPRAGGWATSGAARSSGMGVWGAQRGILASRSKQPPAGDARWRAGA